MFGKIFRMACCIGPFEIPFLRLEELTLPVLIPRTHVEETDGEVLVYFEISGVKKEDIELYASEKTLRLKAKVSEEVRKALWKPREYRKSICLPVSVDVEKAKSKYEAGVLTVTLPKKVPGKRIPIE